MTTEQDNSKEEALKEEARYISIKEGRATSVMDGFGVKFISPFAVALGASNNLIALLTSLPHLIGNFSQLGSIKAIKKTTRKKLLIAGVTWQALMWLPIMALSFLFFTNRINSLTASILLLVFYTILITVGAFVGPAWSSWMRDIVPTRSGEYFAKRNTTTGMWALISLLLAGFFLDFFKDIGSIFMGFIFIFATAMVGRFVSARFFTKQYEPEYKFDEKDYFSIFQFLKKMPSTNFGKFVIFLSLMSFATAIASPFFTVYMLKDLGFNQFYTAFTAVTMASIVSHLFFANYWGKFIDTHGNVKVLKMNSYLVALVPILWVFSLVLQNDLTILVIYLIMIEIFSGLVWSGFNLAAGVFMYEAVTKQKMPLCVTYNGILGALGGLVGAMLGGYLSAITLFTLSPFILVFLISGIIRLGVAIVFSSSFKEVRPVEQVTIKDFRELFKYMSPRHFLEMGIRRIGFHHAS